MKQKFRVIITKLFHWKLFYRNFAVHSYDLRNIYEHYYHQVGIKELQLGNIRYSWEHIPHITRLAMTKIVENDKKAGSEYLVKMVKYIEILKEVHKLNRCNKW